MAAVPVWAERAVDRSPATRRHRERQVEQATLVVDAARRLLAERGDRFTTQELVKEAGIGLPTFYRLFGGKDQLLLTLFEDLISEHCALLEAAAAEFTDPIARLRFMITATVQATGGGAEGRIMTAQYWRLHELFPGEMARATQQYADLLVRQLEVAGSEGRVDSASTRRDAWFTTKLVVAVFHAYAFADAGMDTDLGSVADELWTYCRRALGITDDV